MWCDFGHLDILLILGVIPAEVNWWMWGVFYLKQCFVTFLGRYDWKLSFSHHFKFLDSPLALLLPFFSLSLHMWYSWTVREHIIWHLWNTPSKAAEMESVLKMCERFGPFIKEAHSFFHVLPHGVFSPKTPFHIFFFASPSLCFPLLIWDPKLYLSFDYLISQIIRIEQK